MFRRRIASDRFAIWWDPRRSLGARLALVLLPLLLVPVLFYWYSSSLLWKSARQDLAETIIRDAIARERGNLRHAADRRGTEMEEESQEVLGVARSAAADVRHALEEGPLPGGEPLEDVPRGPIRTSGRGASAAMVSRAAGITPLTLRDLAATRRLEPMLGALASGHPAISSVFVVTSSGVLRAFPWSDLAVLVAAGG